MGRVLCIGALGHLRRVDRYLAQRVELGRVRLTRRLNRGIVIAAARRALRGALRPGGGGRSRCGGVGVAASAVAGDELQHGDLVIPDLCESEVWWAFWGQ